MTKHSVTFKPFAVTVNVLSGTTLLDAAHAADLPLKTTCGGKGTCGDCRVRVLSGSYTKKTFAVLDGQLASQGYTLACQTAVKDDLTVFLPEFQELLIKSEVSADFFEKQKESISGFFEHDPAVKTVPLDLPPPSLEDNSGDLKRLERVLQKKTNPVNLSWSYSVLKKLARTVREQRGRVCVAFFQDSVQTDILDIWPRGEGKKVYGAACDLGTSTVALHLVDLTNGRIAATASSLNRQMKCGEDIISRINYARKPGRLEELHKLAVVTINSLLEKASRQAEITPSDIYGITVAGNTTMAHLLFDMEPRYIREDPYVPTFNLVPLIPARELGLALHPEARLYFSPSVGSYVGGDITAGLLCTPLLRESKKVCLFIDVGTNGELVVGNKDWLMTCACSAGPAFEGSGIRCGMPASDGAIERIRLGEGGEPEYSVIGGSRPKGLCGSGLVDLLSELFIRGFVDRQGRLREKKAGARLVDSEEGPGFLVESGENTYWGKDLILTERDIANLIRTKAAVFSACTLLLKNVGLSHEDIAAFYVAGGFGRNLDIDSAVRIGLLPDLERDRFHYLGNTALLGAYLILCNDKNRDLVNATAEKMTYIELNTEPAYMNEFMGALFLPHTDMDLFPSVKAVHLS